jgi:hypothetical protein
VAFEQSAQPLDHSLWPFGKIGEGAMTDFAGVAIGFAQKKAGRGVAVGDGFDKHGYVFRHKKAAEQVFMRLCGFFMP